MSFLCALHNEECANSGNGQRPELVTLTVRGVDYDVKIVKGKDNEETDKGYQNRHQRFSRQGTEIVRQVQVCQLGAEQLADMEPKVVPYSKESQRKPVVDEHLYG